LKITPSTQPERGGPLRLRRALRPHIVFFGEIPLEMDRIQREIAKAR
jgi:NAD-dependent SIR2 family protein deacetylase